MPFVLFIFICSNTPDSLSCTEYKEKNLFSVIAGTFIRIYQSIISPHQGDVCNFTPSCSRYAYEAIEKNGVVKGTLMAFDRLERCNPYAWQNKDEYYKVKFVKERGYKLYDPVKEKLKINSKIK